MIREDGENLQKCSKMCLVAILVKENVKCSNDAGKNWGALNCRLLKKPSEKSGHSCSVTYVSKFRVNIKLMFESVRIENTSSKVHWKAWNFILVNCVWVCVKKIFIFSQFLNIQSMCTWTLYILEHSHVLVLLEALYMKHGPTLELEYLFVIWNIYGAHDRHSILSTNVL